MPVNTPHEDYIEAFSDWMQVRDAIRGERRIKSRRELYLPRPTGKTDADYSRYLARVHWFNAIGRAADGLHGEIFKKDPLQNGELPEAVKALLEDVDHSGTSLDQFASDCTWDALMTNWGGLLVDYDRAPDGINWLESDAAGYGAFVHWYKAEDVINWSYKVIRGRRQLSRVILYEPKEIDSETDIFVQKTIERYRVLTFNEAGVYIQQLYIKNDSAVFLKSEDIVPRMDGNPFDYIPFFPCPGGVPEKSMLLDLCNENLGHYQQSADYNDGLHYTAIPTPVILGATPPLDDEGKPKPVGIGGTQFLFLKSSDGSSVDAKYMEFSGAGLGELRQSLDTSESRMAILGARIISAEKKGVETAEAARIHRAGENGVLGAYARNMSEKLTKAIRLMLRWNGVPEDVCAAWSYTLNTDYDDTKADAAMLSAVISARQSGDLPRKSVYLAVKQAGYLPEDMTYEAFVEEVLHDRDAVEATGQ
jgi:hypothetical protein